MKSFSIFILKKDNLADSNLVRISEYRDNLYSYLSTVKYFPEF